MIYVELLLPFLMYLVPSFVVVNYIYRRLGLVFFPHGFFFSFIFAFLYPSIVLYPFMVLNIAITPFIVKLFLFLLWLSSLYFFYVERMWLSFMTSLNASSVFIVLLSFLLFFLVWVSRVVVASPTFSEIDPYYYAYSVLMLVDKGHIPYVDDSAWAYNISTHRVVPFYTALIYSYYSLIDFSKYSLPKNLEVSLAANAYPPIAAALTALMIFALSYTLFKRYDVVALLLYFAFALSFSFTPIFFVKTMAGVFEVQPYAFFSLTALFYVFVMNYRLVIFPLMGLFLSTASYFIFVVGFSLYIALLFFMKKPFTHKEKLISIYLFLVSVLLHAYNFSYWTLLVVSLLIFIFVNYRERIEAVLPYDARVVSVALFLLFMITPFGYDLLSYIKKVSAVGSYSTALEWTIAEQTPSSENLNPIMGFLGLSFPFLEFFVIPIKLLLFISSLFISLVFSLPPFYTDKVAGLYMVVLTLFFYAVYYFIKNDEREWLFLSLTILPLVFVTLFKSKFVIYFSYVSYLAFLLVVYVLFKYDKRFFYLMILSLIDMPTVVQALSNSFSSFFVMPPSLYPQLYVDDIDNLCKGGDYNACLFFNDSERWLSSPYRFSQEFCVNVLKERSQFKCRNLPFVWLDALWFLRGVNGKITSWWDYGHWINFFSNKPVVLRNEHANITMIYRIAYGYVMNDSEMIKAMKDYGSNYLIVDREIVFGSQGFGGKFHALNYLACVYANETDRFVPPGKSLCERKNLWETFVITKEECIYNPLLGEKGFYVDVKTPYVKDKAYCLAFKDKPLLYYTDKKDENGVMLLNKGFPYIVGNVGYVLYTKDKVWNVNGELVDGWEDRKGRFYGSIIYRGFVLGHLEGFVKVFDNGYVKIYKVGG